MPTKKTPPRATAKAAKTTKAKTPRSTKKRPPRRGGGLKIAAKFEALIGQPRECVECGETKDISIKTYAQSKKSPDGVSPVCRSCQGSAARKHQMDVERGVTEDGEKPTALSSGIRGFKADPSTPTRAFENEIDAKVERLTELSRESDPMLQLERLAEAEAAPAVPGRRIIPGLREIGIQAGAGSFDAFRNAADAFLDF